MSDLPSLLEDVKTTGGLKRYLVSHEVRYAAAISVIVSIILYAMNREIDSLLITFAEISGAGLGFTIAGFALVLGVNGSEKFEMAFRDSDFSLAIRTDFCVTGIVLTVCITLSLIVALFYPILGHLEFIILQGVCMFIFLTGIFMITMLICNSLRLLGFLTSK